MRVFGRDILPVVGGGVRGGLNGMIWTCIIGIGCLVLLMLISFILEYFFNINMRALK